MQTSLIRLYQNKSMAYGIEVRGATRHGEIVVLKPIEKVDELQGLSASDLTPCVTQYLAEGSKALLSGLVSPSRQIREATFTQANESPDEILYGIFAPPPEQSPGGLHVVSSERMAMVGIARLHSMQIREDFGLKIAIKEATTTSIIFEHAQNRNIGQTAAKLRTKGAFASGVDVLKASVVFGNDRSSGNMKKIGFWHVEHDAELQRNRFRKYNPETYAEKPIELVERIKIIDGRIEKVEVTEEEYLSQRAKMLGDLAMGAAA